MQLCLCHLSTCRRRNIRTLCQADDGGGEALEEMDSLQSRRLQRALGDVREGQPSHTHFMTYCALSCLGFVSAGLLTLAHPYK